MAVIVFEVIICSAALEAVCVFWCVGEITLLVECACRCLCAQSFKEAMGNESRVLL